MTEYFARPPFSELETVSLLNHVATVAPSFMVIRTPEGWRVMTGDEEAPRASATLHGALLCAISRIGENGVWGAD